MEGNEHTIDGDKEVDLKMIISAFDDEFEKLIHNSFLDIDEGQNLNSRLFEREKNKNYRYLVSNNL